MVVLGEKPRRSAGAVEGMFAENGEDRRLRAGDDFDSGCVKFGILDFIPTLDGVRSAFGPGVALGSLKDLHRSCSGGSMNPRLPGKGDGERNGDGRSKAPWWSTALPLLEF